jgi:hypothetical protein
MNTHLKHSAFLLLAVLIVGLQGCADKSYEKRTYFANTPVYMSFDAWRSIPVAMQDARALEHPGKIYFKDGYIYINELNAGVHVIDNQNPSNPINMGFIEIPGSVDIAIKNNTMYVDSYVDLLAIDVTDPTNAKLESRTESIFEPMMFELSYDPNYPLAQIDPNAGLVIGWELEEVTEIVEVGNDNNMWFANTQSDVVTTEMNISSDGSNSRNVGSLGLGGSMARFTVWGQYLYTVDNTKFHVFDVTDERHPTLINTIEANRTVETIFPAENHLFLGTTTGMVIYSLLNAETPDFVTVYEHIQSCDPVVVDGDRAYVTLRSGTECWNSFNTLDVIDLSNMSSPHLISSFPMTNPHGLGIDNETLFLCDGQDGLKVFDASDDQTLGQNQLAHFADINTFDVIPHNNVLIMIGTDGLYQYDYTDVTNITQLSLIPVQN